jgi:hypothetical protein
MNAQVPQYHCNPSTTTAKIISQNSLLAYTHADIMCLIPPTDVYESIAENAKAPQNLRDAALFQLKQTTIQSAVGKVASMVEMPSDRKH